MALELRLMRLLSCVINLFSDKLSISANGPIAGIEIHASGVYSINDHILPDGWQYFKNDNIIVMVDIEGKGIHAPVELKFDGEFKIEEYILTDWRGHVIAATVNIMPGKTLLNRAYPNPFNPMTTLSYKLSKVGIIDLSIYNINGQVIETLVNEQQHPGEYTLIWNAFEQPSGMYFLRLQSENDSFYQKLMIIK